MLPIAEELDNETALVIQDGRLRRVKGKLGGLASRVADLERSPPGNLAGRVSALEQWRQAKAPAIPSLSTGFGGLSVSVLGFTVASASATQTILQNHEARINSILSALREREVINA